MKELLNAELELLDGSAALLADRPDCRLGLDHLRSVDLDGVNGQMLDR